ncbi:hypothetical protein ACPV34_19165 [Photobacterium damselae]|uniref:hypothetical protein n=1 Tax=Photobacterium damselae TaxID=38293 RepID=UPI0010FF0D21|nr:hypothetical protein [Photobacterium damselae]TLS70617.1 hypothetical protein FD718_06375 [Photobacterium damselae subsp. damselae]
MKGFLFVEDNCPNASFWITKQGSISMKYHQNLIGCIVLDPKNSPDLLIRMILESNPKDFIWSAEYLNKLG